MRTFEPSLVLNPRKSIKNYGRYDTALGFDFCEGSMRAKMLLGAADLEMIFELDN